MIVQVAHSGALKGTFSCFDKTLSGKYKIKLLSIYGYRGAFAANQQFSFNSYEIQNFSGGSSIIYIHDEFQNDNKTFKSFGGAIEVICYLNGEFTFYLSRGAASVVSGGGNFSLSELVFTFDFEVIDANYIKKLI
jgi:hypothetical protein